ncbi:hypothetical protein DPX16_8540 [Anabarilius grahami]|uniref:Uncharacterized protein n=1 Tax=Anabarilius grahami TaxID=495550 RepID=A0A3N0Y9L3_ANAGA|nr:hypothetical protein DPX16_8540 [Anabarilius grahami]
MLLAAATESASLLCRNGVWDGGFETGCVELVSCCRLPESVLICSVSPSIRMKYYRRLSFIVLFTLDVLIPCHGVSRCELGYNLERLRPRYTSFSGFRFISCTVERASLYTPLAVSVERHSLVDFSNSQFTRICAVVHAPSVWSQKLDPPDGENYVTWAVTERGRPKYTLGLSQASTGSAHPERDPSPHEWPV